ncbi:MAG: Fur family transcriptional regulator [Thermoleophilia bacterium]
MTHSGHDHDDWLAHARLALSTAGHRAGAARTAVLGHVAGAGCCRTAQEIHDAIRADGGRAGIATVYRVLDQLVGLRLVTKIEFGDGVSRFEPAHPDGHHHHHLVCTGCGSVLPFEDEALEAALHHAAHAAGFAVDDHEVVVRGACRSCRAAAPKTRNPG